MNYLNVDNYRYEGEGDVLQAPRLQLWEKKWNNWAKCLDSYFIDVKLLGCEIPDVENLRIFSKSLDFLEDLILDELKELTLSPVFTPLLQEFKGTMLYNALYDALKNFHDAHYGQGYYAESIKANWRSVETQELKQIFLWMRGERFIEKDFPQPIKIFEELLQNFSQEYPQFEIDIKKYEPVFKKIEPTVTDPN